MPIDEVLISYTNSYEKDLQLINGYGNVTSYITEKMIEQDNPAQIGSISYNLYNTYAFQDDISVIISADAISGDEEYMISTLLKGDHGYDLDDGGKIVTLDRISITGQYYSESLESLILQEFIDYFSYKMFDYIVVIAAKPINSNGKTSIVEFPQLKLYEDFNFINLGGTERRAPVMVKSLNLLD